ncbi:MAG: ABC transporter ATP-binding protein [Rhodospirillales bacterium]
MAHRLEIDGVRRVFPGRAFGGPSVVALHGLSLTLDGARPEIVAVVGESGSGKSTLAQIALGLDDPSAGTVRFDGTSLGRMDEGGRVRFRRAVQAVLQDPFSSFNPFYRVEHAAILALVRFGLAPDRRAARSILADACEAVGLNPADTLGRFPHELSGGQRQRLMVARAMAMRPAVLVADEPVSMVDASLRATILAHLAAMRDAQGVSIIYVTHDLTTAYQVADRLIVLYRGHVVETGTPEEVLKAPAHPDTRLLVDSVPWPDLARPWGRVPKVADGAPVADGCPFRGRCPDATAVCARMPGPAVLSPTRTVRCHLHRSPPA